MSKLLEQLTRAQIDARKAKDEETLSVLQMALCAIKNEKINTQKELTDDDIVAVLRRQVKQLTDARKDFLAGGRQDLIDKTDKEIEIISQFLPKQMSEEDVENIARDVVARINPAGPQDFGKVMGAVMGELKGKADGGVVQGVVKKVLSS